MFNPDCRKSATDMTIMRLPDRRDYMYGESERRMK